MARARFCSECGRATWDEVWPSECDHCGGPLGARSDVRKPSQVIVRHWDRTYENHPHIPTGSHLGLDIKIGRDCPASKQGIRDYAARTGQTVTFDGI